MGYAANVRVRADKRTANPLSDHVQPLSTTVTTNVTLSDITISINITTTQITTILPQPLLLAGSTAGCNTAPLTNDDQIEQAP